MTVRPKRLRLLVVTGHRIISRKLESKIAPLLGLDEVEKVYLVTGSRFSHEKVQCFFPKGALAVIPVVAHLWSVFKVFVILFKKRPGVVITVGLIPHGIYTLLLATVFGRKKIFLSMGMNELIYDDDLRVGRMLRKIAFLADLIGTRGTRSRAQLVRAGFNGARIFIAHNVFDFDDFKPVACGKIYDLIYVGLLEPYKRIDLLIEAVRRLVEDRGLKEIRLAIVGEGGLKSRLKMQCRKMGVETYIDFLPAGGPEYVCRLLNQSRVFVMTSQREGLPMAMIEAMSCGLPVVVFEHADIGDVAVHGDNSLLCAMGDTDCLTASIERVLTKEKFREALSHSASRIRDSKQGDYSIGYLQQMWRSVFDAVSP